MVSLPKGLDRGPGSKSPSFGLSSGGEAEWRASSRRNWRSRSYFEGDLEVIVMSGPSAVQEANEQLARQINEEARSDPHSPYAGKFVGIANGQVIVVADT